MKPWICLTFLGLILEIGNIWDRFMRFAIVGDVSTSVAIVDTVCNILGWVLGAYTFLVVRSFVIQIEDEEGAGGDHEAPYNGNGKVHYKREEREMQKA